MKKAIKFVVANKGFFLLPTVILPAWQIITFVTIRLSGWWYVYNKSHNLQIIYFLNCFIFLTSRVGPLCWACETQIQV